VDADTLVFDIGFHLGEDTKYYLARDCRVVAVEADARLVERAVRTLKRFVSGGRLILVNAAVGDITADVVPFHLSRKTEWSSRNRRIADRLGQYDQVVDVPALTLSALVRDHGCPYYCKLDLEGSDCSALGAFAGADALPEFASVETECLGEREEISEVEALATLDALHLLGYRRFKLVDQRTLEVLEYGVPAPERRLPRGEPLPLVGHSFPEGSSGPFGHDLAGEWLDYGDARRTLIFHRRRYFSQPDSYSYGFWCDWHAWLAPGVARLG
jgi:FkbM family methyltransferase